MPWGAAAILLLALCSKESYGQMDNVNLAQNIIADTQLNSTIAVLTRQIMLDQWYRREEVRSSGQSGIKQVRHQRDGSNTYHTETHIGGGVASIHDHGDSIRTMGMGEFHVVLNGVEFRTRHNDYLLDMPSTTSRAYHEVQMVPFPAVPPSVLRQDTVEKQIAEMQMYFKAFKEQNATIRDYMPYFKPVMSYLEGAWTFVGEEFEEPFPGERHWVDAKTWRELEDKVRFTGYAGTKEALENLAYLPRTFIDIINDTIPVLAQWNYRILCHPLKNFLHPNRLHVVDDLATRMAKELTLEEHAQTREARFRLNPYDEPTFAKGRYIGTLLDQLMEEIPGKENYGGSMTDEAFGKQAESYVEEKPINAANYHHLFRYDQKDGMGMQIRHRGYSDESLFMARTTQDKIAGMDFNNCMHDYKDKEECEKYHQKWSYAFPMEMIYLTPLATWNPYNINYYGWAADGGDANAVRAGGRDGTEVNPFNGTNSKHYYRTPSKFFSNEEYIVTSADTSGSDVFVLDKDGKARKVRASGHRTFIPDIPGVGTIRQRYPIMPVHAEGTTTWKELEALKELILNRDKYANLFPPAKPDDGNGSEKGVDAQHYATANMLPALPMHSGHTHVLEFTEEDLDLLRQLVVISKTSSYDNGHQHQVSVAVERMDSSATPYRRLFLASCDNKDSCWDGHSSKLKQGFLPNGTFVADVEDVMMKVKLKGDKKDSGCNVVEANSLITIMLIVGLWALR